LVGPKIQRGHGAPLEPLAQLRDALSGVGALSTIVQATEIVVAQVERGHDAPLEPLAQLGDALGGVGALLSVHVVSGHATDRVTGQTAIAMGRSRSVKGR